MLLPVARSITQDTKHSLTKTLQGADPTADEANAIHKKMETVVELTEKQLDLLVKDKPRIDELHVGGEQSLSNTYNAQ